MQLFHDALVSFAERRVISMNSIKERIDEIHNGSVKAIMDGITSSSPIEFLNAMIFGTRLGIDNAKFIESVKNARKQ